MEGCFLCFHVILLLSFCKHMQKSLTFSCFLCWEIAKVLGDFAQCSKHVACLIVKEHVIVWLIKFANI